MLHLILAPSVGRLAGAPRRWLAFVCTLAVALLVPVLTSYAQEADDTYLRVFNLINTADDLAKNSEHERALAKYREAYKILETLKREFPEWNPQVVAFRSQYLAKRINELMNPPQQPGSQTQNATNASGTTASPPGGIQVEVLAPGNEPREVLRWQPEAGSKQTFLLTQKTSMSVKAGEAPARPMTLPPIRILLEVTTKEVTPEGDISYETVIREAGIAQDTNSTANAQANAMLSGLIAPLKGASASGTVTTSGVQKALKINMPEAASALPAGGAREQLQQLFGEIALPLPEEAVGAGAKWRVTKPSNVQGIRLVETATHQLVESQDGLLRVQSTAENKATGSQRVQNVEVTRLEVKTSGDLTLDLTKLMPEKASLRSRTLTEQKQTLGGTPQAFASEINTELEIEAQ